MDGTGAVTPQARALNDPAQRYQGQAKENDRLALRRLAREAVGAARILDAEDLAYIIDQANQDARSNVLRAKLLRVAARSLPSGAMLSADEQEQLRDYIDADGVDQAAAFTNRAPGATLDIPDWNP